MRATISLSLAAITTTVFLTGATPAHAVSDLSTVRACQHRLYLQSRSFLRATVARLERCVIHVLDCNLRAEIDGEDPMVCLPHIPVWCHDLDTYVAAQETLRRTYATNACAVIDANDLTQLTNGLGYGALVQECAAATVADLMTCIFSRLRCTAERQVFRIDPRSADALSTAGFGGAFPCLGP